MCIDILGNIQIANMKQTVANKLVKMAFKKKLTICIVEQHYNEDFIIEIAAEPGTEKQLFELKKSILGCTAEAYLLSKETLPQGMVLTEFETICKLFPDIRLIIQYIE